MYREIRRYIMKVVMKIDNSSVMFITCTICAAQNNNEGDDGLLRVWDFCIMSNNRI